LLLRPLRVLEVILACFVLTAAFVAPARAASYMTIYSFKGGSDGAGPSGGLVNIGGVLYGTTSDGGAASHGTVFSISPAGVETVLYSFQGGSDGAMPYTQLINVGGTLYGTTLVGGGCSNSNYGTTGCGTVFSVTPAGVEAVLYSFQGGSDGAEPNADLIEVGGRLYGATASGGGSCATTGCGTVFSVTLGGVENVLYSFQGGSDGVSPVGGPINVNGTLYGATTSGGVGGGYGYGTIYSVTLTGVEKVLHSFGNGTDGRNPEAGLVNFGGTLYGSTADGGAYTGTPGRRSGTGTVFKIAPAGVEAVLHSFGGFPGGNFPYTNLIGVGGTLYGTTPTCGHYKGTVFSLTRAGAIKVLHYFTGQNADGALPTNSVIYVGGSLYGTTLEGGAYGYGTVFKVTP
jgi:uncharacterized repeat protein (TIGR03803 family)